MADGVLVAIGGEDEAGLYKTSAIYGFHDDDDDDQKWRHIGDMPFACSWVDTLLLSGGGLLMVDGCSTQQVLKITLKGRSVLLQCN